MERKEFFESVVKAIRDDETLSGEVAHIDLWNRNIEFIEQETAWARPAVFVEIGNIEWKRFKDGKSFRGKGTVSFHVVTDWVADVDDSGWSLSEKLHAVLTGLKGKQFDNLNLLITQTNHDHAEVIETIDTYEVWWSRTMSN